MIQIDMPMPKNCYECPLCQGEYGPGNEKSYCAVKPKVDLKYRGIRPKECPIVGKKKQMTNKETIETLKQLILQGTTERLKKDYEAIDIAIKTLEEAEGKDHDVQ